MTALVALPVMAAVPTVLKTQVLPGGPLGQTGRDLDAREDRLVASSPNPDKIEVFAFAPSGWMGLPALPATLPSSGPVALLGTAEVVYFEKADGDPAVDLEVVGLDGSNPVTIDADPGVVASIATHGSLVAVAASLSVEAHRRTLLGWITVLDEETSAQSVATDGDWIVAGAPGRPPDGIVHVFKRDNDTWIPWQTLQPEFLLDAGAEAGTSVAVGAGCLFVGVPGASRPGAPFPDPAVGTVLVYALDIFGEWEQVGAFRHQNTAAGDRLGTDLAWLPPTLVVGAEDQKNAQATRRGAAHVFHVDGTLCTEDGVHLRQVARLSSLDAENNPTSEGALGTAVGVTPSGVLASDPEAFSGGFDGVVYYYHGLTALHFDGFESGTMAGWSKAVP